LLYRFLVNQQREAQQTREATFGDALHRALIQARRTQKWLAAQLGTNSPQVTRWVKNYQMPHRDTVRRIEELLDVELHEAFRDSLRLPEPSPGYELFVSAPISGLSDAEIDAHRNDVTKVVDAAKQVVEAVYWSGEKVAHLHDLGAPDIATETSLKALANSRAYLYLQFAETIKPSGALVELGFALARKLKTTIIIKSNVPTPYMLEGFEGVAASLDFLPRVHIYVVDDVEDAIRYIGRHGDELLVPKN
jgi:transcriptional regulator with XRE-family HTH domain